MGKVTPGQQRRMDELRGFLKTVEHVKHLVAELDQNRAAKATILNGLSSTIERELSTLRQRALASNVGSLADSAGTLSIAAARAGGGIQMKVRTLQDGVHSMLLQLDQAMKAAVRSAQSSG